jgi:hypothetical protein
VSCGAGAAVMLAGALLVWVLTPRALDLASAGHH